MAPLKHAFELNADSLPAHQLLGYALLSKGYASEAIPHLQRAPDKTALGIAEIQTGQLPEAVANLQAALAAHPNDPDLLYYLGRASGLLSKQSVDTLLAAYPDSARAHQAMAENYFVLRRMPDAEKEYRAALRLRPGLPEVHWNWAKYMLALFNGPKQKKSFAYKPSCSPGTPKLPTVWERRCWNKVKRTRRGRNSCAPTG
jgi:Tfp pilus assembly protein PilF